MQLKTAKGLALQDILSEVHEYVHRSKYSFLIGGGGVLWVPCTIANVGVFCSNWDTFKHESFMLTYSQGSVSFQLIFHSISGFISWRKWLT